MRFEWVNEAIASQPMWVIVIIVIFPLVLLLVNMGVEWISVKKRGLGKEKHGKK